jgi:2-keto-3-deoxy-L-rhamnonate aldolase RhmA
LLLGAGRAPALPLYVRVRNPSGIQSALDLGARGIVVPHVDTPDIARAVVSAARFVGGMRGYSGSTRHADYGRATMADAIVRGDQSKVIVQIEHPVAIDNVEAILAVPGIDGILIGRADLALAMGYMSQGGAVDAAVDAMLARITPADKIIGLVVSSAAERQNYTERGANWFLVGTDHGLLCRGVRAALS